MSSRHVGLGASYATGSLEDPKIFGRLLTSQDTETRFVSCLKNVHARELLHQTQGGPGPWDAEQLPLQELGDLNSRECKVRAELKQVWLM